LDFGRVVERLIGFISGVSVDEFIVEEIEEGKGSNAGVFSCGFGLVGVVLILFCLGFGPGRR
jgi:hypothetical protein